jgi:hypothetical protein
MMRRKTTLLILILFFTPLLKQPSVAAEQSSEPAAVIESLPETATLRQWIEQIKRSRRGPFKRLRWFCSDGAILPPKPYACSAHGGGVQHGEWTEQVKLLRQHNYLIATLLADLRPETFFVQADWPEQLKQILLEQYLIEADDGWLFRRARYYRGALQAEDENWHGEALLLGLLDQPKMLDKHFLLLREAVRVLPHGRQHDPLIKMRQLALEIEASDPNFAALRIKLHTRPDAADTEKIQRYAEQGPEELQEKYQQLAKLIDRVTKPHGNPLQQAYQLGISRNPRLVKGLGKPDDNGSQELSARIRFARSSQLLFRSRTELSRAVGNRQKLNWLDASLDLEHELYRSANQLLSQLPTASRRQQLAWIEQGLNALYGIGFLSDRQWSSQMQAMQRLLKKNLSTHSYQQELTQLSHSSRWTENSLRYHFDSSINHLAILDTEFNGFLQERLRASPLLPISLIIESLLRDNQQMRGVNRSLFGQITTGLQPLNPGLARGRLELVSDPLKHKFSPDGIYLLTETVADLPPVAGILTRGAGNTLSHIQLLARNLGIPNLAINQRLVPELAKHTGEIIIVAVSPGGVVQIEKDSTAWQRHFNQPTSATEFLIDPDLNKLDLQQKQILSLEQISARDSGRIAGPKGANLGELKQIYEQLVPEALVIPFGRFRSLLDNSTAPDGQTLFNWMQHNYRRLEQLPDSDKKQQQTAEFLTQLQQLISSAPLPEEFLSELRSALEKHFGADGSFGVFVRSDTNVEDLPNFTGAGLNKTVPHVVGFAKIVAAIRQVWASPFSLRAYSWRQAHMRAPEHVYASVLLMLSVPADKSGVMATTDLLGGDQGQMHVATNEGIGGAVSGQRTEELLINKQTGEVRLLSQASAEYKRILLPTGGIGKVAAAAPEQLLTDSEIQQLREMAVLLPRQFPGLLDKNGQTKPADIEFGFLHGSFVLFQIRPLLESKRVKMDLYLAQLDAAIVVKKQVVDLDAIPLEP